MSASQQRLQQATRHLRDNVQSGMVAASNGHNSFLETNCVYVLSGVRPIGESAVVLGRDGSSTLIVTPAWDVERATAQSATDRTVGTDDLVGAIADAVKEHGIELEHAISVGFSLLARGIVERLAGRLGKRLAASEELVRELAKVRTDDELANAEHAIWIAERGYERLLEVARPGMREFELAAELYCQMKELGAEDNFLLMSASQHNLAVRAAGERILDIGDIILAEITPCYRGQFVQICRTAVIGETAPLVLEKFAVLQSAMQKGQAAAISGARVSDVTRAINAAFEDAGYGSYCRPPYMRVRGHGLGITSSLPGDISVQNDRVLEDGMVFVMHPNQYIPETGYLMCGETVVIAGDGARSLSARDAELDVITIGSAAS